MLACVVTAWIESLCVGDSGLVPSPHIQSHSRECINLVAQASKEQRTKIGGGSLHTYRLCLLNNHRSHFFLSLLGQSLGLSFGGKVSGYQGWAPSFSCFLSIIVPASERKQRCILCVRTCLYIYIYIYVLNICSRPWTPPPCVWFSDQLISRNIWLKAPFVYHCIIHDRVKQKNLSRPLTRLSTRQSTRDNPSSNHPQWHIGFSPE